MTENSDEISEDVVWITGYMVWGPIFFSDKCLAGGSGPVEGSKNLSDEKPIHQKNQ